MQEQPSVGRSIRSVPIQFFKNCKRDSNLFKLGRLFKGMAKEEKGEEKKQSTINVLVENSVTLQRVMTEVAISLKALNEKLDNLLGLFDEAAKKFNEKKTEQIKIESEKAVELKNTLQEITEQNRVIAKGVMLLEQAVRTDNEPEDILPSFKPKPLPEFKT